MPTDIDRLLDIMARLRDRDDGCPWDVEQNFATIAPYTIEEAYEVADAIERNDMAALKEELGDLLFQVVFHSRMAEEDGKFGFGDVVAAISDKMVRRHPHVFAGATVGNAAAQTAAWEEMKASERLENVHKEDPSVLAGVPTALPGLTRAEKLQKRAARIGFDWPTTERVMDKVHEEVAEVVHELNNGAERERLADEIGDLLFVCVNLARKLEIDAESALRAANAKFERRFRTMETEIARKAGAGSMALDEMEAEWEAAKRALGHTGHDS
ncbi:MAG: nucleoside triphosphate pyrophosphohydrolase [Rhodospirillaceae bacterium]